MGKRKLSGGKGGDPGGDPPRRSSRERKKVSFGADFEQEDNLGLPTAKKAKPSAPKLSDPNPSDPTPGTSQDPVPEPDPASEGSITWPSDEEHWKLPHLPNNHSKCF